MRVQVDITTALLDCQQGQIYETAAGARSLDDALVDLGIDSVRVAFFSDRSPVVPVNRSLEAVSQAAGSSLDAYICLHCSDTWADPSHQSVPADWNFHDRGGLRRAFAAYLADILERISATGTPVRRIQLGNEVTQGFLWPFGRDWDGFADLYVLGAALVRRYLPQAQLVLQTDLGGAGERALKWYAEAERRRLPFDAIGVSYYPVWHGDLERFGATVEGLSRALGRPVLVAETGYMNTPEKTAAWFGDWTARGIPYTAAGQAMFLDELAAFIDGAADRVCRDVFWWGAFAHRSPDHFPVSWFDRQGHALAIVHHLTGRRARG